MLELDRSIGIVREQTMPVPSPGVEQMSEMAAATAGLEDQQLQKQVLAPEAGVSAVVSNRHEADTAITTEMPASHDSIDPAAMTKKGLIKACKYFADLAAKDPVLADRAAERTIQSKRQEMEMRQRGMDSEAIKKQQWSLMRGRHKEKVRAEESPVPEKKAAPEARPTPAYQPTTEQEQRIVAIDSEPVFAALQEVVEKSSIQQAEALTPVDQPPPTKEAVAPAGEPPETRPVTEQSVVRTEAEHAVPMDIEQIYAAVTETVGGHARAIERLETMPDEDVQDVQFADYGPSPGPEAASAKKMGVVDMRPRDDAPSEQLLFGGPIDTAETLPDEALLPSLIMAPKSIDNDGVVAPIDTTIVLRPELPEIYTLAEAPEQTTWAAVLEKEPLELCDDFAEALQSVVATPEQAHAFDEARSTDEPMASAETTGELRPPSAIAMTVAERLHELETDEQEAVSPLLKEIVVTIQAVDALLTAEETEPGAIETAQTELEVLVVALFEHIGITCEAEDIQQFIAVLLRSDFQPSQPKEPAAVDLEHEGTHEAKLHFAQLVSGLSDVEKAAERLLGKLVLFYTVLHGSPEYELAGA